MIIFGTISSSYAQRGSYESIASFTATQNTTTISFTSIPATYKHLEVRYVARRTGGAGSFSDLALRMNSVSSNSYDYQYIYAENGGTPSHYGQFGVDRLTAGMVTAPSSPANYFAAGYTIIPEYASTNREKTIQFFCGQQTQTSDKNATYLGVSNYRSTSAVNRLDFYTGGDFIAGTTFSLYGIKA